MKAAVSRQQEGTEDRSTRAPIHKWLPRPPTGLRDEEILGRKCSMGMWVWLLLASALASVVWRLLLVWVWIPFRMVQSCVRQDMSWWPSAGQGLSGFLVGQGVGHVPRIFRVGKTVRLIVSDPTLVRDVLHADSDSYSKPLFVESLDVLGKGIFTSSGPSWANQRELLASTFHVKYVKPKLDCVVRYTRSAIQQWDVEGTNPLEVDMYRFFLRLTLTVILKAAYGVDIEGDTELARTIVDNFDGYLHKTTDIVFGKAAAVPGYELALTALNQQRAKHAQLLTSSMVEILRARQSSCGLNDTSERTRSLLHKILPPDGAIQLTQQEVMDNCLTFLLAGHETTASLLTWTVYLLALHPLWQERARAEVEEFCQSGKQIDHQSIGHLKTVSMIMLESLRLFPPQPVIGRRSLKENQMGRYLVPAGLEILIPVGAIHQDEHFWGSDSREFKPARFANGIHGACKEPMAFLPFGTGPRTCIGQGFALLEAKAIMAVLLPRYSWKLSPHYRHSPDVTLTVQPKYGMPVALELL